MKNNRDDFKKSTIDILRKRVAYRCSNPDCRVVTVGPTQEKFKSNSIGVAAHICAASAGGPRFDPSMTTEQRKSIENAIWLCSSCSVKIDKDPHTYIVDLLHDWKEKAEQLASEEMGNKLPSKFDAINTLTAAMSGTSHIFVPDMLKNTSIATANILQKVDPRFHVNVEYVNQSTKYTFLANSDDPIDIHLNFTLDKNNNTSDFFSDMTNYGKSISIPVEDFHLSGSPIFEFLQDQHTFKPATLSFVSESIKSIMKIWLSKSSEPVFILDDFHGDLFQGDKAFLFEGTSCGELVNFSFTKDKLEKREVSSFTLSINFTKWLGLDILSLPYFTKIYDFIERIKNHWAMNGVFEVNGNKILEICQDQLIDDNALRELFIPLKYILMIRKLSESLGVNFTFEEIQCARYEFEILEQFYMALSNIRVPLTNRDKASAVMGIICEENIHNIKQWCNCLDPVPISMEQKLVGPIRIFGKNVQLPALKYNLTSVYPKIEKNISDLKVGDQIKVEFIPSEDCEYYLEIING